MAFWNTRDDEAEAAAEELESAATGFAPAPAAAVERPGGLAAPPLGLIAVAVAVLLILAFLGPLHGFGYQGWFSQPEPWVPQGEAVYASQRLADIETEQRLADARAAAWDDVPAIDAHAGSFAAQTPPR